MDRVGWPDNNFGPLNDSSRPSVHPQIHQGKYKLQFLVNPMDHDGSSPIGVSFFIPTG